MQTIDATEQAELARITRCGLTESVHIGTGVVLAPDGSLAASLGSPHEIFYPRSALKPLQAIAAMKAGAELQGAQIALAAGSHTGSFEHMKVAQSILQEAGLDSQALGHPTAWPADIESYHALVRAGHGRQKLAFNCSGKHAAMLWGCTKNGWPIESYLDPGHPLQQLILETVAEFTGDEPALVGTDGCGAPLPAITPLGLARAYSILGAGVENIHADARVATVATAMVDYPEYVQGQSKPVTELIGILDAVVKNGAEGVLAIGLRSGASAVVKIADGSSRPAPLVALYLLEATGMIDSHTAKRGIAASTRPVLGADQPVGSLEPGADLASLLAEKAGS